MRRAGTAAPRAAMPAAASPTVVCSSPAEADRLATRLREAAAIAVPAVAGGGEHWVELPFISAGARGPSAGTPT